MTPARRTIGFFYDLDGKPKPTAGPYRLEVVNLSQSRVRVMDQCNRHIATVQCDPTRMTKVEHMSNVDCMARSHLVPELYGCIREALGMLEGIGGRPQLVARMRNLVERCEEKVEVKIEGVAR